MGSIKYNVYNLYLQEHLILFKQFRLRYNNKPTNSYAKKNKNKLVNYK